MKKAGSLFQMPLGKYLYGSAPTGFADLHVRPLPTTPTPLAEATLDTAFSAENADRASRVDVLIKEICVQEMQTIPHHWNKNPLRRWEFDKPEIDQCVVVNVRKQDKTTKKYYTLASPGRIVAFTKDDIDHTPKFRVSAVGVAIASSPDLVVVSPSRRWLFLTTKTRRTKRSTWTSTWKRSTTTRACASVTSTPTTRPPSTTRGTTK